MALKRPFLSDTGEDSVHCSGLGETEHQSILPVESPLSQYSSFSGKTILKRPFLGDTGEDLAHLFRCWGTELQTILLGDAALS